MAKMSQPLGGAGERGGHSPASLYPSFFRPPMLSPVFGADEAVLRREAAALWEVGSGDPPPQEPHPLTSIVPFRHGLPHSTAAATPACE
ncbi:hypothetical protein B296_00042540 [Ensete ventricosum]|uniref:Uncharacterized protein n=1 Tax=Ensete ventricosum TaxID=4639 RepID=A0A426XW98_ENSVE|nr:hypothetical protein B296_00042540 [Ensete ventricosum]